VAVNAPQLLSHLINSLVQLGNLGLQAQAGGFHTVFFAGLKLAEGQVALL
jgi:hypothetical protein